jgi:hypothetical protein
MSTHHYNSFLNRKQNNNLTCSCGTCLSDHVPFHIFQSAPFLHIDAISTASAIYYTYVRLSFPVYEFVNKNVA